MDALAGSHWSTHRWTLLASVRGRRGEADYAYVNEDGQFTLLIRRCPSLTERRLTQTRTILREGDFTWIVIVPRKVRYWASDSGIDILDETTFCTRSPQLATWTH